MSTDVFSRLCDITDDLQRLCPEVQPDAVRCKLEALVARLDGCIDDVVGLEVPAPGSGPGQALNEEETHA